MNHFSQVRRHLLWILILATLGIVMLPGLKGGFFFDDMPNIVENQAIHIHSLDFAALQQSFSGPQAGPLGRPVSTISFALTHYFFGLNPFAFKAINLGIHAINGFLVAWLVTLLLRSLRLKQLTPQTLSRFSIWVAAIWLVHPINVMPVMLSVQRMTLLSGMFLLLALISHLKAMESIADNRKHWRWLLFGWLVFWPLAVFSKETGLMFPLYILAITTLLKPEIKSPSVKNTWVLPISILVLLLIAAAMLYYLGWHWLSNAYAIRPFSLSERLLTESRVLWFYASQILLPNLTAFGVYLDDFRLSTGIITPVSTLLSILGWLVVILGILFFRKRYPFLCFCAAWFLVGHSLESTLLPLEIAHEYRNYLPSIGLIAGIGYLSLVVFQQRPTLQRAQVVKLAVVFPFLVLAFFTWSRTTLLSNPILGTQIEAAHHPNSARALYAAALTLFRSGYGDQHDPQNGARIRDYFQRAAIADSSFKDGYPGLIVWACASERPIDPVWIAEFSDRLAHTPFSPRDQDLPHYILKLVFANPQCLNRQDTIRLFEAGASNSRINDKTRSAFFSVAADYELAVSKDPKAALAYLVKASTSAPYDLALRKKIEMLSNLTHMGF